jgi:hypothetical protein
VSRPALPALNRPDRPDSSPRYGELETPFGKAAATATAPNPLFIHRMARKLYLPMLAMGAMLVPLGLALSIVQSKRTGDQETFVELGAWVQGAQFLGETLILSGIAFLLGTVLASLRAGGGEVQESLGVTVMTILVAVVLHFAFAADIDATAASLGLAEDRFVVLEAIRRIGVAIYLFSITLGLATIVQVLRFQSVRIRELATEQGRS